MITTPTEHGDWTGGLPNADVYTLVGWSTHHTDALHIHTKTSVLIFTAICSLTIPFLISLLSSSLPRVSTSLSLAYLSNVIVIASWSSSSKINWNRMTLPQEKGGPRDPRPEQVRHNPTPALLWLECLSPERIGTETPCNEKDRLLFAAWTSVSMGNGHKTSFL
jgi:hypothetical protein